MAILDPSIQNFARRKNRTNIRVPLTFGLGFWPIISLYDVSRRRMHDLPFDWWKIKPTTRESSVFSKKKDTDPLGSLGSAFHLYYNNIRSLKKMQKFFLMHNK